MLWAAALALGSCDLLGSGGPGNDDIEPGSLVLEIHEYEYDSAAISPVPLEIVKLDVTVISSTGHEIPYRLENETPVVIESLEPGTWTVEIGGRNAHDEVLVHGRTETLLAPDAGTREKVSLEPLPGKGTVSVTVKLPAAESGESRSVTVTLTSSSGRVTRIPIEVTGDRGSGIAADLASGAYRLTVEYGDDEIDDPPPYTVIVLRGKTTVVTVSDPSQGGGGGPHPVPASRSEAIIADHEAVLKFESLTQAEIERARKLLVSLPGESHARAYLYGLEIIEHTDPRFAVDPIRTEGPGAPAGELRVSRTYRVGSRWFTSVGAEDVWTHRAAVDRMIGHITYHRSSGTPIDVFGWVWCWDMTETYYSEATGTAGRLFTTFETRDGSPHIGPWGRTPTESEVSLADYFAAMEEAAASTDDPSTPELDPSTEVIFITGSVDGGGNRNGRGADRARKNAAIREYVRASNKVLLDYEDILTHSPDGVMSTQLWEGEPFPIIYSGYGGSFAGEEGVTALDGGSHVNREAAVRLGKALWWLLAQLAAERYP